MDLILGRELPPIKKLFLCLQRTLSKRGKVWDNMKKTSIYLIIAFAIGIVDCRKHYQGDIESFSLEGEWSYQFTDSISIQEADTLSHGWLEAMTPVLFRKNDLKQRKQWIWLKKDFVIPGHFIYNPLYLDLGEFKGKTEIYLNGVPLDKWQEAHSLKDMFLDNYYLVELYMADLRFGHRNSLLVGSYFKKPSDSLYIEQPAIYSRIGFLKKHGFPVSECPYRLERDVHAVLEDFSLAWVGNDYSQLFNFFAPDFQFRGLNRTDYSTRLIDLKKDHQISQIEISDPNFFLLNGKEQVLVFGDWIVWKSEETSWHIPFILQVIKSDDHWLIGKIY